MKGRSSERNAGFFEAAADKLGKRGRACLKPRRGIGETGHKFL